MLNKRRLSGFAAALITLVWVGLSAAQLVPRDEDVQRIRRLVATIAQEAAALCPLSDPADQVALDSCRSGLFKDSYLKRNLARIVLWGRPSPVPETRLKDTTLTQLGAEVLSGLYLPLFMFNGRSEVEYDPNEGHYKARVEALFRNNLAPGEYPYPFWHNAKKWSDYEHANGITFWIDPYSAKIVAGQFSREEGADPRLASKQRIPPAFDGKWMWVDDNGERQPKPALFVGLFRADNPYLDKLQTTYKDLALAMRDGTCNNCHVPDNPEGLRRLVLLQTPVHAASEIRRIMAAVRTGRMPLESIGIEKELDPQTKETLLKFGTVFESTVSAAYAWEREN
jgi:hypothetical protein